MSKKAQYEPNVGFMNNDGFFPHKTFCINGLDITAPAKLEFSKTGCKHAMRHGEYLYAMPGSGAITEAGVIVA